MQSLSQVTSLSGEPLALTAWSFSAHSKCKVEHITLNLGGLPPVSVGCKRAQILKHRDSSGFGNFSHAGTVTAFNMELEKQ